METAVAKELQAQIVGRLAAALERDSTGSKSILLDKLREVLSEANALSSELSEQQLSGREGGYTRELLFAHPEGLFTIMLLTWRKGQHSPVHGHWTWCGYVVLKGELSEQLYKWEGGAPNLKAQQPRCVGDVVVSDAGHGDIHRLGNGNDETAVSLHIYGVDREHVATHINRVFIP